MYKILLGISAILMLTIIACNKTSDLDSFQNSVHNTKTRALQVQKNSYGFLQFSSRGGFDSVMTNLIPMTTAQLDSWETGLNFTSRRRTTNYSGTNYNTTIYDEILLSIIDKDGLVQIGNTIFKAENDQGLCWTLSSNYASTDLSNLKNRVFVSSKMNKFNDAMVSDVYDTLATGIVGINMSKTRGINEDKQNDDVPDGNGTTYRADCKNVYQNIVFAHSLLTEMKYMRKAGGIVWSQFNTYIGMLSCCTQATFTPKNKPTQTKTPTTWSVSNGNKLNWRPYGPASRKLIRFNMPTTFYYSSFNQTSRQVNLLIWK
jgi:hypothetical protein